MNRRAGWLSAVGLVVAMTLALGACTSSGDTAADAGAAPSAPPPTSSPDLAPDQAPDIRGSLAIVGDSITEQGQDIMRARFEDRWNLRIDGRSGYTIDDQIPAAQALAQDRPTQMIVNLGTNDVLRGHSAEAIATDLQTLLDDMVGVSCIHVVTVAQGMVLPGQEFTDAAVAANQAIVAVAARNRGVDVVDWSGWKNRYEAGSQPDGPMVFDTIHPTEAGQEALADLYEDALGSCGG